MYFKSWFWCTTWGKVGGNGKRQKLSSFEVEDRITHNTLIICFYQWRNMGQHGKINYNLKLKKTFFKSFVRVLKSVEHQLSTARRISLRCREVLSIRQFVAESKETISPATLGDHGPQVEKEKLVASAGGGFKVSWLDLNRRFTVKLGQSCSYLLRWRESFAFWLPAKQHSNPHLWSAAHSDWKNEISNASSRNLLPPKAVWVHP